MYSRRRVPIEAKVQECIPDPNACNLRPPGGEGEEGGGEPRQPLS